MFDFLIKVFITPENVAGVILRLCDVIGMCFIFSIFQIKWYKSLIPFYDKYLIYGKVFQHKWLCFISNLIFMFLNMRCLILVKRHLFMNVISFLRTREFSSIEIDVTYLIILLVLEIISVLVLFVFERVCNYRIVKRLQLGTFFQVGTFICPGVFLLVDAIFYRRHNRGTAS